MNRNERLRCSLGGYSPKEVENESQDMGRILRVGTGVLVSANFAAINWAVAGWIFSDSMNESVRCSIAIVCAVLGVILVCVFDPSFIYFLDTRRPGVWGSIKASGYAIIRVGLILMISGLTSQAIMPLLLKNELAGHALKMREAHEKSRNADLAIQFDTEEKKSAIIMISTEIARWQKAAETLPQNIQGHLTSAENCWQQYNARKAALIRQGLPHKKASAQLQGEAQRCGYQMQTARKERDDYFASIQEQLKATIQRKNKAIAEFDQTKNAIEQKTAEVSRIEKDSYTPTSTVVLANLLENEPAAKYKWVMITGVLMAVELLFLLLKLQAGQTNIGQQIAANRLKQEWAIEQGIAQSRHDHTVWAMLNAASLQAAEIGIANPNVTQAFEETLTHYLRALAPLEACRATTSTMGLNATEVEKQQRDFPQLARLIGQLWTAAVRKAAEILVTPSARPGQRGIYGWTSPPTGKPNPHMGGDQMHQQAGAAAG